MSGGLSEDARRYLSGSVLWAANGNTGPATFWTLYYVMRDPQLQARVRGVAGGDSASLSNEQVSVRLSVCLSDCVLFYVCLMQLLSSCRCCG